LKISKTKKNHVHKIMNDDITEINSYLPTVSEENVSFSRLTP